MNIQRGVRMDKSARLASFLFIGVILLPLIGLMMMDYQLKKANDITGEFAIDNARGAVYGTLAGVAIIAGICIFTIATFVIGKLRNRKITTPSLVEINEEIGRIDQHLKRI
jgi:cytosine/uracil/thiamine/allantoin permease